jgi:hypothetical protein
MKFAVTELDIYLIIREFYSHFTNNFILLELINSFYLILIFLLRIGIKKNRVELIYKKLIDDLVLEVPENWNFYMWNS